MNEEITTKELAALLGITIRRVQQYNKDGIINNVTRGKFNAAQSIQKYITYQLELERKKYKRQGLDLYEIRKRREAAEAELKEIELQKTKGELIEIDEMHTVVYKIINESKMKLLSIPNSISTKLLKKTSKREVNKIIKNAIYESLSDLSRMENAF